VAPSAMIILSNEAKDAGTCAYYEGCVPLGRDEIRRLPYYLRAINGLNGGK